MFVLTSFLSLTQGEYYGKRLNATGSQATTDSCVPCPLGQVMELQLQFRLFPDSNSWATTVF